MEKAYRTLRGFLKGKEREEDPYFDHSATLRIAGDIPDMDELTRRLGLKPTYVHRRGDRRGPKSPPYRQDMWQYKAAVDESESLHRHIDALWSALKQHKNYLLSLKDSLSVDVFVGYRSNCDTAGIEVPYTSLEMFIELQIPFGVSIIVT